jgi:hypothetical protein
MARRIETCPNVNGANPFFGVATVKSIMERLTFNPQVGEQPGSGAVVPMTVRQGLPVKEKEA